MVRPALHTPSHLGPLCAVPSKRQLRDTLPTVALQNFTGLIPPHCSPTYRATFTTREFAPWTGLCTSSGRPITNPSDPLHCIALHEHCIQHLGAISTPVNNHPSSEPYYRSQIFHVRLSQFPSLHVSYASSRSHRYCLPSLLQAFTRHLVAPTRLLLRLHEA